MKLKGKLYTKIKLPLQDFLAELIYLILFQNNNLMPADFLK